MHAETTRPRRTSFSTCSPRPTRIPRNGHTILYFGADRASVNGDSNIGFWFNQDPAFGFNGCKPSPNFSGVHENGDLFIVSAFTNGGTQPTIDVYQWQNAGTANAGLVAVSTGDASCVANGVGQTPACAIGNSSGAIATAWPYGGSTPGSVPANGFFEGGIDLSVLNPAVALPCFSSYLGETRSSQELTATVKDFALGSLNSCGSIELKKTWSGGGTGSTTLKIGSTAGGNDVAAGTTVTSPNDGTTGAHDAAPGTYYVNETHDPELHLEPRLREQQGRHEPERHRRSEQQRPVGGR